MPALFRIIWVCRNSKTHRSRLWSGSITGLISWRFLIGRLRFLCFIPSRGGSDGITIGFGKLFGTEATACFGGGRRNRIMHYSWATSRSTNQNREFPKYTRRALLYAGGFFIAPVFCHEVAHNYWYAKDSWVTECGNYKTRDGFSHRLSSGGDLI